MTNDEALEKAQEIVDYLFANGFDEQAERLVLQGKGGKELGGWSRAAVKTYLIKALQPPEF